MNGTVIPVIVDMALRDASLRSLNPLGAQFAALGATTFGDALNLIASLPYGRNSDRANPSLVLAERRGTCSTKHALLAELARELDLDVRLALGIYEMREENTPGVGRVLAAAGIDAVPEAHCYLSVQDERIDVTRSVTATESPFERLLHEEEIIPAQIGDYKVALHRQFIENWAHPRGLDPEYVWQVREHCIQVL